MAHTQKKTGSSPPSLAWFAHQAEPFQWSEILLQRLRKESSESRFLEWKETPPISPALPLRTKYRVAKAVVSFANTEGGFVVFGVDSKGHWLGFSEQDLKQTDLAALAELINGCIAPEIGGLSYAQLQYNGRLYPVLHTPPSELMPHVTTKDIPERLPDGKHVLHLTKHAVYCRYAAKSDLATATQFARIISTRTDMLKGEMLRRVKEVEIPILSPTRRSGSAFPTILRVAKGSKDSSLPAVRITRDPTEASGLIVTEELSDALFDEINNVFEVNTLLSHGRRAFVFGHQIYYRIYAERQHIRRSIESSTLLAESGVNFYAPLCYWLLRLPPERIAATMLEVVNHERAPGNRLICRLAILLGPSVAAWLKSYLDQRWANHRQPAEHYFSFKKMLSKYGSIDPRLTALQISQNSEIHVPDETNAYPVLELLKDPQQTSSLLSKACMSVFTGDDEQRRVCRLLDILTYGAEFRPLENPVLAALQQGNLPP